MKKNSSRNSLADSSNESTPKTTKKLSKLFSSPSKLSKRTTGNSSGFGGSGDSSPSSKLSKIKSESNDGFFYRNSHPDNFDIEKHFTYINNGPNVVQKVENARCKQSTRFVVISDTHGDHESVPIPDGDVFIHCGDFTNFYNSDSKIKAFNDWLGNLEHEIKIVILGNHEKSFKGMPLAEIQKILFNGVVLFDNSFEICGLKVYGSSWNVKRPFYYMANAFAIEEDDIKEKWNSIPNDIDILITHIPPKDILDGNGKGPEGCQFLKSKVIGEIQPTIHVFGHNHFTPGWVRLEKEGCPRILFGNASQQSDNLMPLVFEVIPSISKVESSIRTATLNEETLSF